MVCELPAFISVSEVSLDEARRLLSGSNVASAVGHADTAHIFSKVLDIEVPMNRQTLALQKGEQLLVGQYIGPRLPEGATELPAGATIKWLRLVINH